MGKGKIGRTCRFCKALRGRRCKLGLVVEEKDGIFVSGEPCPRPLQGEAFWKCFQKVVGGRYGGKKE